MFSDKHEPQDLNTRFTGSYELFKWIIKKYQKELPYGGEILQFARATFYSKDICHSWKYNGVQVRSWNGLHKDLLIAGLVGKIKEPKSLQQLQEEFETLQNPKS